MKKILLAVCLLFVAVLVNANQATVTVSSLTVTGVEDNNKAYPTIDGAIKVQQIILANDGAVAQTVTIYEMTDSTTTANAIGTVILESTGTVVLPYASVERIEDLGIKKSSASSNVYATVQYK
jgi:hypothetical protein